PTYNASQQAPFPLKTTALHNPLTKGKGLEQARRAAFQTPCLFKKGRIVKNDDREGLGWPP
ncbi:hypothetical protein, partial [Bacteroides uniformis]|uniref:hypothetical protein n=1 Tax=Bacteroides uniformis TaxID=820 RepID=UPI001AA12BBD